MASRKSRPPSSSRSQSPRIPAPPGVGSQRGRRHTGGGHDDNDYSPPRKRRPRSRFDEPGYTQPREKNVGNKVDLLFCIFQSASSSSWRTAPYHFDRRRIDDRDLWEDIRGIYKNELTFWWKRSLLFKRLKLIAPITYTRNEVPCRVDDKQLPTKHTFMHAYHHANTIRPDHEWVDFFVRFADKNPNVPVGLEFVEGLWAEKLAAVAVLITIAIIVVSIVWCVKGGDLQTVFTVMGFVLSGAAAEIALVALYYQVTLPG